jgi:hypothetical protein
VGAKHSNVQAHHHETTFEFATGPDVRVLQAQFFQQQFFGNHNQYSQAKH